MSFVVISGLVWVVMQTLGEMSAYIPTSGSSVPLFVKRYVEPSLAFAAGWNYWCAMPAFRATFAFAESDQVRLCNAGGQRGLRECRYHRVCTRLHPQQVSTDSHSYWSNPVPVAVWLTIVLVTIVMLNIFVVSWYGESEFWFASIKIIGILGLIVLGVVLFFGGGPNHDRLGFRYWQKPGAFIPFAAPGNTGKL